MRRVWVGMVVAVLGCGVYGGEGKESFSAGMSDDNSDGCDIAAVSVAYLREDDGLHVHGRYTRGGNLACKAASTIDLSVEPSWGLFSLELAHDRHAVSVQEVVDGRRVVWYGAAEATIVAFNFDHTFTRTISQKGKPDRTVDLFNVEIGVDAVNEAPRVAFSTAVPIPSVPLPGDGEIDFRELTLDYDAVRFPGTGAMQSIRASLSIDVGADWAVGLYATRTFGLDNAPDPVDWRNDAGLTGGPASPPRQARGGGIEVTKRL